MPNRFWIDVEQRRALRNWAAVLSHLTGFTLLTGIVVAMIYAFGGLGTLTRINWLGVIAIGLIAHNFLLPLTLAIEVGVKSFTATFSKDGGVFNAQGRDEATQTGQKLQEAGQRLQEAGESVSKS